MINLAIIGASYLQLPLIKKAKEMGYVTHVFAWKADDVGEKEADFFYPISIVKKNQILDKCQEIGTDGICSIASDLASITVNYVAQNMGLISNNLDCSLKSTNKYYMRRCFEENGDPSPRCMLISNKKDLKGIKFEYPLIVKPTDRSGSRGVSKIEKYEELNDAIKSALKESFDKEVLIEEYVEGQEYSIESITYKGIHTVLTVTNKYTTGSPNYVETGHLEPAGLDKELYERVEKVVKHALDSLGVEYGASHSEVKIDSDGNIKIIEIGSRMGGDMIGSSLVELSTGYDFVESVIDVSFGRKPKEYINKHLTNAAIKFVFDKNDIETYKKYKDKVNIVDYYFDDNLDEIVTDSSNRHGYFVITSDDRRVLEDILENK